MCYMAISWQYVAMLPSPLLPAICLFPTQETRIYRYDAWRHGVKAIFFNLDWWFLMFPLFFFPLHLGNLLGLVAEPLRSSECLWNFVRDPVLVRDCLANAARLNMASLAFFWGFYRWPGEASAVIWNAIGEWVGDCRWFKFLLWRPPSSWNMLEYATEDLRIWFPLKTREISWESVSRKANTKGSPCVSTRSSRDVRHRLIPDWKMLDVKLWGWQFIETLWNLLIQPLQSYRILNNSDSSESRPS